MTRRSGATIAAPTLGSATPVYAGRRSGAVDALLASYDVPRPVRSERPWVIANLVSSFDGRTAVFGRVGALSTPVDQLLFHHLRALSDTILVGAATVRAERYGAPRLAREVRAARCARGQTAEPTMCIVSRSLDLDGAADSLRECDARPLVITCDTAPAARVVELAPSLEMMSAGVDRVDFARALAALRRRGARVVLCEGGPTVHGELLRAGLIDEVCITYAPFLGGDDLGLLDKGPARMQQLNVVSAQLVEGSVFVRALIDSVRL